MKVVIDTNVLVSAVIRDRDPEKVVLFVARDADSEWVASPEIVHEYKEVLNRPKFKLSKSELREWTDLIDRFATVAAVDVLARFERDPKDTIFLACALATGADYLITGDRDFSEVKKLGRTKVVSVRLFKKLAMP